MILSLNLLYKLNPKLKKISVDQLCNGLMDIGCEVETINNIAYSSDLVFAKVTKKEKHPNSDKLNLVKVKYKHEFFDIVCGADNFDINDWVVLAQIGAKLANGLEIEPRKVRDYTSYGMLCAYGELNPNANEFLTKEDQSGIIKLLNKDDHLKTPYQILNLKDTILDISIPSNRNDLNGYLWLTKEISAYFSIDFEIDSYVNSRKYKNSIDVKILSDDVHSYGLVEIRNLQHQIPWTLKTTLINNQQNIIGNFADYMNYLTLITANPLHAFDKSKIVGKIVVKNADSNATMIGLDKKEYQINKGDIIIVDDKKIIALAGIIGSLDSAIDKSTTTALVECANFNPTAIIQTAKRLKITTTASQRFSKPLTNFITKVTLKQILKTFGINASLVCYFKHIVHNIIKNELKQINEIIGSKINLEEATKFLRLLGYKINDKTIITPDHRYDVVNRFDVYEDVMKKFSINTIKEKAISFDVLNFKYNTEYDNVRKIANKLINLNIFEAKTYNLKSKEDALLFDFYNFKNTIEIANPISNQRSHLKLNNIQTLLEVVKYNVNQKNGYYNFFEFSNINPKSQIQQNILSVVLTTPLFDSKINDTIITHNFNTAKALAFEILDQVNINYHIKYNDVFQNTYAKNSISIYNSKNQLVGVIAEINNKIKKQYDINQNTYIINLNLTNYLKKENDIKQVIKPSMFNDITKDVSLELDDNIILDELITKISLIPNIVDIKIVDLYIKENQNKVYTIKYSMNNFKSTMNQNEINDIENEVSNTIALFLKNHKQ